MASCLGVYIGENLIKYAKVSKDNTKYKIENYGIKFYEDNIEQSLKQIVDETFGYKIPISANLTNEHYTNFEIFGLLKEMDKTKSIRTEFEYFCTEKGKNRLTLEYRTIKSPEIKDKDKNNVLCVYSEKGDLTERINLFDSYRMCNLSPVSLAIHKVQKNDIDNVMFVNLEDKVELTTIVNGTPYRVDVLDFGIAEIIKKIADKENSISKAYDICKNTTLYTADSQNLQSDNSEYLEYIIPTLNKIIDEIRNVIDKNNIEIDKLYISGMGIVINNIDLYFQENFLNYKCEIVSPYFVDRNSLKLNIRDYIEVNSAIAMALQGLEKDRAGTSFVGTSDNLQRLKELLTSDVSTLKSSRAESKQKKYRQPIKINNIVCVRFAYSMLILLAIYIIITSFIANMINKKIAVTQDVIDDTKTKNEQVAKTTALIEARAENYESILKQLQEANDRITESYLRKNAIPNLLSEIMFAIPKEAQLLSVSNTEDKHVVIQAQAQEYQYLGYFKSELQNQAILVNVTSTSGTRVNDMIQVTIEGDLPY